MLIMAIYKAHFPLKRKGSKTWGALALSALFLAKTPSEYIQRGFFLFLGSQKCTKNAPKLQLQLTKYIIKIGGAWQVVSKFSSPNWVKTDIWELCDGIFRILGISNNHPTINTIGMNACLVKQ